MCLVAAAGAMAALMRNLVLSLRPRRAEVVL